MGSIKDWVRQKNESVICKTKQETQKESSKMKTKNFKNKDTLRDLLDIIKYNNIHITGLSEGKKRDKGPEKNCLTNQQLKTYLIRHLGQGSPEFQVR